MTYEVITPAIRYEECAADCTKALELLEVDPNETLSAGNPNSFIRQDQLNWDSHWCLLSDNQSPFKLQEAQQRFLGASDKERSSPLPAGPVPPAGSAKRRVWVLKTVARRGSSTAASVRE